MAGIPVKVATAPSSPGFPLREEPMSVITAATDGAPAMGVPFVVVSDVDVSGFRDGDPDAIRALYRAYGRLVFSVASRVLGDRTLAEEGTQQTFVQAWQAAHTVEPSRPLRPWPAAHAPPG